MQDAGHGDAGRRCAGSGTRDAARQSTRPTERGTVDLSIYLSKPESRKEGSA